eukprot:TRINITY_DN49800_c0_g1_i1.p1 TRINITY_DN49800_c0_g1~~TRINITY_DN49800_c0_g1_i1.p1  ORF type:complete len:124 (-),score=18.44 TRINITY_DN49800_c0_g1_i1:53-424(-)
MQCLVTQGDWGVRLWEVWRGRMLRIRTTDTDKGLLPRNTLRHGCSSDDVRSSVGDGGLCGDDWRGVVCTIKGGRKELAWACLLYTSDAADEEDSVDLGGRRIIKKKKKRQRTEEEKEVGKRYM